MPDHGSIAVCVAFEPGTVVVQPQLVPPSTFRAIRIIDASASDEFLTLSGGRDDVEGSPAPPSFATPYGGTIRLRLGVEAGARSVSVKVKQPSAILPRPTMRIMPNAAVGIAAELIATAPTGAGWVTVGPIAFTATAAGGIFLELSAPFSGGESGAWWDTVRVQ
jgi:hypothetical protein